MFPSSRSAFEPNGWTARRLTRAAVVPALIAALLVVAPPAAEAVDFTVSFVTPTGTTPETGTHDVEVILNTAAGVAGADIVIDVIDTFAGNADGDDYFLGTTRLTFGAGSGDGATQTATIDIIADGTHEADETIELGLLIFDPGGDAVTFGANPTQLITINDDDPVTVSFSDPTSSTGESGAHTTTLELAVPGGGNLVSDVTVDVVVDGGTATSPADYTLSTTSVTFLTGAADGATGDVDLTIAADAIHEDDETIDLSLALASGPGLVSGTHEVTINDDDPVTVSFSDPTSSTGESGTHTTTLELAVPGGGNLASNVTVDIVVAGGSATSPADYTLSTTSVTFLTGAADGATGDVDLVIVADGINEDDETIDLSLAPASGPGLVSGTHEVTINDGDNVTVSFSDSTSSTGESGTHTTTLELAVPGGGNLVSNVTVDVIIDGGTADTPADYSLSTTSVTFLAGTASGATDDVDLTIVADDIDEDDETIDLSLAVASGPVLVSGTHEVTITDDDTAGVIVSPTFVSVTEGEPGATYTVRLTSEPTHNVRIEADTSTGEADVTRPAPGFVSFGPGDWQTLKEFTVTANDDKVVDGQTTDQVNHTVSSTDPNYNITIDSVLVTVRDNDELPVANPDFYNVNEGGTLSTNATTGVLFNDTGLPILWAELVTPPTDHVGVFSLAINGSFTYTHDGSAGATDTFTYRVIEESGAGTASNPTTVTITIDNVAPDVTAGDDVTVMEEENVAVNATFIDPGVGDSHTATIDWGDGTVADCSTPACTLGAGTVTGSHSYGFADVYTVTVRVSDGDDVGSDSFTVTVENANLMVTIDPFADIDEGDSTTLNATFTDRDRRGAHEATVDWGDGTVHDCATSACTIVDNGDGTGTVTGSHPFDDDGSYTVSVRVSDPSGDEGSGGASIDVANVAPRVQITDTDSDPLPNSSNGGEEGVRLRLRSRVIDPGTEEFSFDWKIRLLGQVVASGTGNKLNYTPAANGTYFVSLSVDDGDGGVDADSVLIVIDNAVPVIDQIDVDATPAIGSATSMDVHFSDPGTSDDHVVTVSWGEGSPQGKPGASPLSFSHTYASAGTRNALVCVTDDDGGESCASFYVNPGVTFSVHSDFDGNGYEDLPIGVPGEDGTGAVTVLYATRRGLRTSADEIWVQGANGLGQIAEAGDGFGSVLAWGDFNLDGYSDLAVGAPTEDLGGRANAGLVHVIPGSATGLTGDGDQVFHQGTAGILGGNQAGDRFGSALAVGDFNGDGFADLAIGVPNEDIDGLLNSGRVAVLFGSPDGLAVAGDESWDQNQPGVIGSNRADTNRGAALAAGDFDRDGFWDLAIGIPGNDTSGKADSGAVLVIGGSIQGMDAGADQWWNQNTPDIADRAQRKDRFGAVLEVGDFNGDNRADLAIGIPSEGVSRTANAGAVAVILGSGAGLTAADNKLWSEETSGILGDIKRNDRFGFALAAGDYNADGRDDLAIGVPYQEIGRRRNAGDVAVIYGGPAGLRTTGNQRWNEATSGVKGRPVRNDHLGWALRAFDERADGDADLAIGIPDQNIGGNNNAGAVLVLKGRAGGITAAGDSYWHQDTAGIRDQAEAADKFGKAM